MADLHSGSARGAKTQLASSVAGYGEAASDAAARRALLQYVELFFFAYRDFTGEPDSILEELGLGRAHHRVLHFVHHYPGLRVIDLLDILKITKQSLSRVLRPLLAKGFIVQCAGKDDRRERLLYTTTKGKVLADRLAGLQMARVAAALATAGADLGPGLHKFLTHMTASDDRERIKALLGLDRPERE